MRRLQFLISAAILVALSGALTGCGSIAGYDPTDLLDILDTKKKLPGDRKPVFPEGVPGLQPGVPRELYRGGAAEQQPDPATSNAPPAAEPRGRGGKSKTARNKPAVVSASPNRDPAPAPDPDAAPVEEGGTDAAPPAPKKKIVRRRTTAPPPDQAEPAAQAQSAQPRSSQPAASPFPAPMPAGTFQR